jgi:histidine triad (HIT) family protein
LILEDSLGDCVFCKIVAGEVPSKKVGETEHSMAFFDISPRQPLHVLIVPKAHHNNVAELAFADPAALVDLIQLGSKIAEQHSTGSFRLTFNTGEDAGQTVFHAHGHITSRTAKDSVGE